MISSNLGQVLYVMHLAKDSNITIAFRQDGLRLHRNVQCMRHVSCM